MRLKKLWIEPHATRDRRIGSEPTSRSPSAIWVRMPARLASGIGGGSLDPDETDEQRRHEVRDAVDDQGHGSGQDLDHQPAETRPHDARDGVRDLHARVRLDEPLAAHEGRHERLVRDRRDHADKAEDEDDRVQQFHPEHADDRGQRHDAHGDRADQVGYHEDRASTSAVDPHAGEKPDDQERQEPDRRQQAHLIRGRIQHQHRCQRERQQRDLRPEERDGLADPEPPEAGLPEDAEAVAHRRIIANASNPTTDVHEPFRPSA